MPKSPACVDQFLGNKTMILFMPCASQKRQRSLLVLVILCFGSLHKIYQCARNLFSPSVRRSASLAHWLLLQIKRVLPPSQPFITRLSRRCWELTADLKRSRIYDMVLVLISPCKLLGLCVSLKGKLPLLLTVVLSLNFPYWLGARGSRGDIGCMRGRRWMMCVRRVLVG